MFPRVVFGFGSAAGVGTAAIAALALAPGCASEDDRAPYVRECDENVSCSVDAGHAVVAGPGNGTPPAAWECLSEEVLLQRTEMYDLTPMTGRPVQFGDQTFNFMFTEPLEHPARIITHAQGGMGLACTEWDGQGPFELNGAVSAAGPVLIEPLNEGDFLPTVLQAVSRSGESRYLPVFPVEPIDQIFEDIGIQRDPDRAQLLLVTVSGTDFSGGLLPAGGVPVHAAAAQAVAFKDGDSWTTSRSDTSAAGDGLALLVNVGGFPTVQGHVNVLVGEGSSEDDWEITASKGAVTYAIIVIASMPN